MEQGKGPLGRELGGRYRITRNLGSGGSGRVWEAYDETLERRVAAEAMGRDRLTAVEARQFARAFTALDHPNIVTVYDLVEEDGMVWLIRPLISGPSLATYLSEHGPMSSEQAQDVARSLLDALAALHEVGVVHGDVRPTKVRMSGSRWVLMPALGAPARDDTFDTDDGRMEAAAEYTAPELVHGAQLMPSSDLFSLGVTLCLLVTGRSPFRRESTWATLAAVTRDQPPSLEHLGEFGYLIYDLLDKDPQRRLTAANARLRLDSPPRGGAPMAAPPAMSMPSSAARRSAMGLTSSLLLVLLILATALVWAVPRAHVSSADVSNLLVAVLPWAVFCLGLCVLVLQARTALTRSRAPAYEPLSVWRSYTRSLAPPARWTNEEREQRRASAEQAVDEMLLRIDQRVASAAPGPGEGRGIN
ncbi:serine/threonine-protein kinase [Streptomyces sp. NPDC088246]|uniref:serine/threonine-protein kinase n=1 Tax=Streptomyces sp. NPDC088246 TaxID=3365842 RepID=UPI00382A487E